MNGIHVKLRDGQTFTVSCAALNELTIGRVEGNDVVLANAQVSRRHARIVYRDTKYIIVDLKSSNGTYVNGKRIGSPQVLKDGDKIYLADFTLTLASSDSPHDALPAGTMPSWMQAVAAEATVLTTDSTRAPSPSRPSPPRVPAPPPASTSEELGGDDEATPPVGMAPSPSATPVAQHEQALVLRDERWGSVHVVSKFGTAIGRRAPRAKDGTSSAPGVQLDSTLIAQRHARITLEAGAFVLRDLGANDTWHDGRRVEGKLGLATGTRFTLADVPFIVVHIGTQASAAAQATRASKLPLPSPSLPSPSPSPSPSPPLPPAPPVTRTTGPPRGAGGRTVIDDDVALGLAAVPPGPPRATIDVRVGGVTRGERVSDDGYLVVHRGKAVGRDARIVQLHERVRDDAEAQSMMRDATKLATLFRSTRLPRFLASDPGLLATSPSPGVVTLHHVVEQRGALPGHVALHIALEVARALAEFHDVRDDDGTLLSLVHRGVTLQNVELARDGAVQLDGYFFARPNAPWREVRTGVGILKGDLPFMAPEQVRGLRADMRSDVWALGVCLYTMASGANPFVVENHPFETVERVRNMHVPPLDSEPAFSPVFDALLERDPDRRTQTARDAITLLESASLSLPPASRLDVERLLR